MTNTVRCMVTKAHFLLYILYFRMAKEKIKRFVKPKSTDPMVRFKQKAKRIKRRMQMSKDERDALKANRAHLGWKLNQWDPENLKEARRQYNAQKSDEWPADKKKLSNRLLDLSIVAI